MTHESPGDFAEFAAAAWPRLVRTAHILTGDFHEAEDLVQTTLVKVYARWRRIPASDIDVYVRKALINNNISRIRKKRVSHLLTPFLPETEQRAHSGHADSIEHRASVVQALAALSARQRTAMVLRYFDDLSDVEIAAAMNCSIGTVKTHIRRGLAVLRMHPALAGLSFLGVHDDAPARHRAA
ncbi:SigE family RNA polymerase sigma factor [Streptomyces sp. SKN60]|uniref:SigE family RNA polymerase sigma factor n=1 Tax=Streptomyces sp. SKN60 TaxID=2855506 RepID=UPI0022478436|nr:SigE family RNA polymerase sigma factor [Streptomyces sp. SKN60]MCX2185684.1 SigE family RNA polymerase sigma factor [Streptomyces sp. SKN60]